MVKRGKVRASGETTAGETTREEAEKVDRLPETEVLPDEREIRFQTPGFSRMRLDWQGEDREVIKRARDAVEGRLLRNFASAYQVMYEVYELVRTPEVDENGEVVRDRYGFPLWRQTVSGDYEEDWSKLTRDQRERFMFTLTTRLFEWSALAADAWGEAMFSKARWEERFSVAFDAPMSGTVDDRKAKGHIGAAEDRYFALYLTLYSRQADAIVRSMELLAQRLKDAMLAG